MSRSLLEILPGEPDRVVKRMLAISAAGVALAFSLTLFVSGGRMQADEAQTAPQDKSTVAPLSLEESLRKAQVGGKYSMLLRQIKIPEDREQFSDFYEEGYSDEAERGDYLELPAGFRVYVAPYWYIWRDMIDLTLEGPAKRSYAPEQVTGPADVPGASDNPSAWTSQTSDGRDEWLLVEFAKPVEAKSVHVHESYSPGAVNRVTVFLLDGREVEAWSGRDPTPVGSGSGISKIPLKVDGKINRLRIWIASRSVPGWNEIDAVRLVDKEDNGQWALAAEASTIYGITQTGGAVAGSYAGYDPRQATGPPNTPRPGDQSSAWVSAAADGQKEWLALEYKRKVKPKSVWIYENSAPGSVYRLTFFDDEGKEQEVWTGKDPTPVGKPNGISVIPVRPDFATNRVKIYLNNPAVSGWNEIDAVGLRDASGMVHWASDALASSAYGQSTTTTRQRTMMDQRTAEQRIRWLEKEVRELKAAVKELTETLKQQQQQQSND